MFTDTPLQSLDPLRSDDENKDTKSARESRDRYEASITPDGRYRLLIEAIHDYAIYMLDAQGRVASWNPGARRFKGYEPEEIIGEHFSRFYTEEDREAGVPRRALSEALSKGKFEAEGWRVRKDGSRFWAHVVIDPVFSLKGDHIGFAKITRDLSERKAAQDELERAREALIQSQKMEAVGQLTGGIAHDFNNLLMAIIGSLELVKKKLPPDPAISRLINNAMEGAKRGATLTQRMLSFARRQSIHPEAIDVVQLVRNMVELLQRSIGPTVSIDTQFPLLLSDVQADENQLEMALLNLAVNARDAMPKGGTIVISARDRQLVARNEVDLPPGKYVCLSVADQGEGMDEATLAKASEPFFTTKGVGKGTGLGLSMVQGMAAQLGGRLNLKSTLGKGTVVEIWLPAIERTATQLPSETIDAPRIRPLRILAVDDDTLVLFNTVAMLEELGHTVMEARNGEEAIRLLAENQFDLVITDQAMPKMTGTELVTAIQKQWPSTKVLLATGYAEVPGGIVVDVPRLAKPFLESDLAVGIASAMGDR